MSTSSREAQPLHALERANRIRLDRAMLRQRVAEGDLKVAMLIADPPEAARGWPIFALLTAQYRWGPERTRRLLSRLMIRETRPLGELTVRQRNVIIKAIGEAER